MPLPPLKQSAPRQKADPPPARDRDISTIVVAILSFLAAILAITVRIMWWNLTA